MTGTSVGSTNGSHNQDNRQEVALEAFLQLQRAVIDACRAMNDALKERMKGEFAPEDFQLVNTMHDAVGKLLDETASASGKIRR